MLRDAVTEYFPSEGANPCNTKPDHYPERVICLNKFRRNSHLFSCPFLLLCNECAVSMLATGCIPTGGWVIRHLLTVQYPRSWDWPRGLVQWQFTVNYSCTSPCEFSLWSPSDHCQCGHIYRLWCIKISHLHYTRLLASSETMALQLVW